MHTIAFIVSCYQCVTCLLVICLFKVYIVNVYMIAYLNFKFLNTFIDPVFLCRKCIITVFVSYLIMKMYWNGLDGLCYCLYVNGVSKLYISNKTKIF